MKNALPVILLFFLFSGCTKVDLEKWELTFRDEFNGNGLDTVLWNPMYQWGQQYPAEDQAVFIDSAFVVNDGILSIVAKRQSVVGRVNDADYNVIYQPYDYTSGRLYSRDSFGQLYGYFETRARVPVGIGFNAAFWLMSFNSWPPEIDVFEILGKEPTVLKMANHFSDNNDEGGQVNINFDGPDLSKEFHVYAIEWNPEEIIWYLDGEKVGRCTVDVPDEPMFLLLSLGVGSTFAGFANEQTPCPAAFEIDYVRVYQKKKH